MLYVTMTDTFMSGWGDAAGKTNKLVLVCENMKEAKIVEANAKNRSDMKRVNITSNKPYYNKDRYYTQVKTIDDMPAWYEQGYFTK